MYQLPAADNNGPNCSALMGLTVTSQCLRDRRPKGLAGGSGSGPVPGCSQGPSWLQPRASLVGEGLCLQDHSGQVTGVSVPPHRAWPPGCSGRASPGPGQRGERPKMEGTVFLPLDLPSPLPCFYGSHRSTPEQGWRGDGLKGVLFTADEKAARRACSRTWGSRRGDSGPRT